MQKLENDMLIICPREEKEKILNQLEQEDKLYNIKFMTKEDYLDNYFFTYQDKAIFYLMKKYHYKVDVCKVYLSYLSIIEDDKRYENENNKALLCTYTSKQKSKTCFDTGKKRFKIAL